MYIYCTCVCICINATYVHVQCYIYTCTTLHILICVFICYYQLYREHKETPVILDHLDPKEQL